MMLAEAGKLKYDPAIRTYLPELPAWGEQVMIRHLLYHTSGLPDYTDAMLDRMFERSDTPDNEDLLAALAHIRLRSAPGAVFEYSNPGYDLLGLLVARVSGQKFPDFMQQRIFAPLGMTRTFSLPRRDHLRLPLLAHSYTVDDNNKPVAYDLDPLDNLVGSGSIYSTVEEMALYDQALYSNTFVKPATLAEAFRSGVTNDGKKTDYGFGWEIERWQGKPYVAHSGAWLAFLSDYVRFLNQELSVIVLFNRDYNVPDEPRIGVQVAQIFLK
ncbi:MAG: serine hydrolase domain-containing protein [Caldilineaceae bacterium]